MNSILTLKTKMKTDRGQFVQKNGLMTTLHHLMLDQRSRVIVLSRSFQNLFHLRNQKRKNPSSLRKVMGARQEAKRAVYWNSLLKVIKK